MRVKKKRNAGGCRQRRRRRWKFTVTGKTKRNLLRAALVPGVIVLALSVARAQGRREIELTAQEILARADRILDYPRGLLKGRLTHLTPEGESTVITFSGSIAENDYLLAFSSKSRGEQLKVLYNLRGEDIWVYYVHAAKLFHKMDRDKYDAVLSTNFSFIDLSNADYQSNYTAAITGTAVIKGREAYRLRLDPIYKGGSYGLIVLYADKKESIPLRIDFHDNDKAILKSLSIAKVMTRNDRVVPVRYDMLDIRRGTVTILEISGLDETAVFDKTVFYHQQLGETE